MPTKKSYKQYAAKLEMEAMEYAKQARNCYFACVRWNKDSHKPTMFKLKSEIYFIAAKFLRNWDDK